MSEAKRGRLREVSIRPMYDEKGKITGHTVAASHEAEAAKKGEESHYSYVPPIESPHESHDGALKAAREHLEENKEKHGDSKRGRSLREAIGA